MMIPMLAAEDEDEGGEFAEEAVGVGAGVVAVTETAETERPAYEVPGGMPLAAMFVASWPLA